MPHQRTEPQASPLTQNRPPARPLDRRRLADLAGLLGIGLAAKQSAPTQPGEIAQRASDSRQNSPSREKALLQYRGITEPGQGIGASPGNNPFDATRGLLSSVLTFGAPTRQAIAKKVGFNPELLDPLSYVFSRLPGSSFVADSKGGSTGGTLREVGINPKAYEKRRREFLEERS